MIWVDEIPCRPEALGMKILGVSGSPRGASSNSALLRTVALLAPRNVEMAVEADLKSLPHFNPDLEEGDMPGPLSVVRWRSAVRAADAVVFACPEYGHGIPGTLKNGLDWLVGSGEFHGKPVAVTHAYVNRARGTNVMESLARTLRAMDAVVVQTVPVEGDPAIWSNSVRACMSSLVELASLRAG